MANYFVGDIQGCYDELRKLMDQVGFDPAEDVLWCTGDLVARGPGSLEVLRLFRELGDAGRTVLGNHDLHLLAVHARLKKAKPKDRLQAFLDAPDSDDLIQWLRCQPLYRHLPEHKLILTHAGVPPHWGVDEVIRRGDEVSATLQSDHYLEFVGQMYGDKPDLDDPDASPYRRQTYTINCLTRMRLLYPDGRLDFYAKGNPAGEGTLVPWFRLPHPLLQEYRLVFGHWAALMGQTRTRNAISLDTGACWGHWLTFWQLETGARFTQHADKVWG
ncbi:symmetrical bis(5'-nucleosyl)-tetraphosphatase [Ferrimonas sp. YFM]|uniref:symmetrical bis(5'-nucleosyl)-tetraphosphatase n=1 Tax=Ferrimonas sp. YFM TaxID=3028878 RepID=UPI0025730884|nr:symmetrical bis(5'-nucleosyl)-tetraphosphatase [Ferrimonas sp. YFM]BDY03303.1 bis(5'-nucleosyl)-tetraphosphatase, symmetrical [Ferrimonas sp. YFM]